MCEAAVGYADEEVYPGALLPSGKLVVSTGFGGIAIVYLIMALVIPEQTTIQQ